MSKKSDAPIEIQIGKKGKVKKPWYREWSEALIVAGILALIIRSLVIQAFKIPSGSMEDTLLIGDHLLVNKFIYGTTLPFSDNRYFEVRPPQRGDVIVFEWPVDTINEKLNYFTRKDFIKRIIGVPGDTVEIRDKQAFVNGEPFILEQAVHKSSYMIPGCDEIGSWTRSASERVRDCMAPVTVPADSYFVMGDNRDNSRDSRFWGFVPRENIKGLAFIKYWSWDSRNTDIRWSRIGRPIK
ncbi:MAG: signal peptidase I [Desulfuromonas sp.]|nr:MAG: signal peptidase I [Desulfuromonas sp.]